MKSEERRIEEHLFKTFRRQMRKRVVFQLPFREFIIHLEYFHPVAKEKPQANGNHRADQHEPEEVCQAKRSEKCEDLGYCQDKSIVNLNQESVRSSMTCLTVRAICSYKILGLHRSRIRLFNKSAKQVPSFAKFRSSYQNKR